MRGILAFPLLFFMMSCYALKVIALQQPVIEARPWLMSDETVMVLADDTRNPAEDARLPVTSQLKPGPVARQAIKPGTLVYPLFVVGDDARSRAWLSDNRAELTRMNALGLVTNIASTKIFRELEALAGVPLQPVNVDELAAVFHVLHYPFIAEGGFVWQ